MMNSQVHIPDALLSGKEMSLPFGLEAGILMKFDRNIKALGTNAGFTFIFHQ
jgi:hypothetical protein